MEEIIYIPISQENKTRQKNQKQLVADFLNKDWKSLGTVELKDHLNQSVKVFVIQKTSM